MSNLQKVYEELKEINGKLTMLVGLGSQLIEIREESAKRAKEKHGLFTDILPKVLKQLEKEENDNP